MTFVSCVSPYPKLFLDKPKFSIFNAPILFWYKLGLANLLLPKTTLGCSLRSAGHQVFGDHAVGAVAVVVDVGCGAVQIWWD